MQAVAARGAGIVAVGVQVLIPGPAVERRDFNGVVAEFGPHLELVAVGSGITSGAGSGTGIGTAGTSTITVCVSVGAVARPAQ